MQPQTLEALYHDTKARAQASPADPVPRAVLWQLFAARGEHDRARKQLDVLAELDASWSLEAESCRGLLAAEDARAAVLGASAPPVCLGEPPAWFALMVEGLSSLAGGHKADAGALFSQAQQKARPCTGRLNGEPFQWVCDADARLGPCLEVMAQGKYFWAPWELVRSIVTRPPDEVRDRLWQHALIELAGDDAMEVFLPVRYPAPLDDAQAMSRRTDWEPLSGNAYVGRGQKCLLTDTGEAGFLDVRRLVFDANDPAPNPS